MKQVSNPPLKGPPPSPASSKGVALFVAAVASFLTPFLMSSLNVALVAIDKDFKLSAVALSWIPTAYLLASAIFLVPFGRLADIVGRKRIFLYGVILYTISCLLLPLARSEGMLIFFRVLEGMGSAGMYGTAAAIVSSVYPPGERGKALGIYIAAVYAGLSLGPPIGGFLTEHFTWRSIFYSNVVIGLVVIVAVLWKLKGEWLEAKGEKFDFIGSFAYGVSLAALIAGFSFLPGLVGALLVAGGVLGLFLFIRWEMRVASPVLNVNLFRNNMVFTMSNVAAFINYSATAGTGFLLSLYLQYIKGFSPQHAGFVLVAQPVVMMLVSLVAGRLSDRMEPRIVASVGMALTAAGLFILIFLGQDTAMWQIYLALIVLGFGFGLFSSPNTNAIMSSVEKKFLGVASGTTATMRLVGQMLSLGFAVMLFSLFIGHTQITPEAYPAFLRAIHTAFIIFAALCVVGVFASLARGKMRVTP